MTQAAQTATWRLLSLRWLGATGSAAWANMRDTRVKQLTPRHMQAQASYWQPREGIPSTPHIFVDNIALAGGVRGRATQTATRDTVKRS